jgi:hypothetical protein
MAEAVVMNKVRVVNDRVLILDDDYEGPAAEARYVRKLVDELLPEAEHFHADLDIRRLSISELSAIIRESVDALALMWAGLEPENRERLEGRLLGLGWADARAKHQRVVERAQGMVARG